MIRHVAKLEQEYTLLYEILAMEKEITNEISILSEMGCYPSVELAIIRKEAKLLAEHNANNNGSSDVLDDLSNEYKLSEKKMIILHEKRAEEFEVRQMMDRKAVKKNAREDMGNEKDPMNFNAQKGRS